MSVSFVVQFYPDSVYLHSGSKNLRHEHYAPINSKVRYLSPPPQQVFDHRLFPRGLGMCTLPGWGNMGKYQKIIYFSEKRTIEKRSDGF